AKLRLRKFRPELGLPRQNDLDELVAGRLEVGQQADLFECFGRQVLCFVKDQDRVLAGAPSVNQEVLQSDQSLGLRLRSLGDPEVLEDILEESVEAERVV